MRKNRKEEDDEFFNNADGHMEKRTVAMGNDLFPGMFEHDVPGSTGNAGGHTR